MYSRSQAWSTLASSHRSTALCNYTVYTTPCMFPPGANSRLLRLHESYSNPDDRPTSYDPPGKIVQQLWDPIRCSGVDCRPEEKKDYFLSDAEERTLVRYYEGHLRDLGKRFSPKMPSATVATALHYFKRFYLRNSVMDFHPKEILVTCVYLACKVEEFNVSISQFVANIKGDRDKASDIILNNELLLMQQLNYNLTVHNPYRPVEGLLIDIKTRYPAIENPDRLREHIEEFLDNVFMTDSVLLYAPSQIALSAILSAASKVASSLDSYVTDILFSRDRLGGIIEAVRKIRSMAKFIETPTRESVRPIEKKLERCRNQENNPDSQIYKQRMQEMLDEDDLLDNEKYAKIIQDQAANDERTLGVVKVSSPSD
ncbi:cyclin-H [Belonocnema kinseyi]|uniref:cyclin-H n=1 Tax=Belonocnema kinseyi TaxID=2817044 RepID=UPI00143D6A07|nr:cyclin-H [Belonocnema kinseyi]